MLVVNRSLVRAQNPARSPHRRNLARVLLPRAIEISVLHPSEMGLKEY
ncbi:MAG: hypothetical protein AAFY15_05700 [Cyanobacteria bacterium J06648_11]